MRTLLAIDRGNDSLKAALFSGASITERFRVPGADPRDAVALIGRLRPDRVAVSCVVPSWRAAVAAAFAAETAPPIVWAAHDSPLPFRIDVDDPRSVGPDRLAAAAGAAARGTACAVVVDAGTAVTVDILAAGVFTGGSIAPGLGLMLDSLHRRTAVLPALDPASAAAEAGKGPPGKSTRSAIAAGTLEAFIGGTVSVVRLSLERAPDGAALYLTGGAAPVLAGRMGPDTVLAPDLVLEGLYRIFTGEPAAR